MCGAAAGTAPARRALGYLAELFRFPGWATADELLRLHQRLSGSTGGATERAELLALVGLGDEAGRRVEAMSKGMQQRLGIAQALIGGPRLLLLDEPTSALDPVGRRIVRDLLAELRRRGVAVLLNTHLLSEVERVCDRVAIIDHGELLAEGRPDDLSRPHGVEVDTEAGTQRFEGATRDDVPAIVERLVAEGERIYEVRLVRSTLEDAYLAVVEPDRSPPPAPQRGAPTAGRREPVGLTGVLVVATYALRESLRRRVFAVVVVLTLAFGGLYAWGASELFKDVTGFGGNEFGLDARTLAGATLLGLAMFGTLFLGAVLAVFLTLSAVRGDAETGLLQPLIVRPLGRRQYLAGRFLAASAVAFSYVGVVYAGAVVITGIAGDWWPQSPVGAGLRLMLAVVVVAALSLLGSIFLTATANGIGVLMIFGAGLLAGLLGSIGDALNSNTLQTIANTGSWLLPFEALYRDALRQLVQDIPGVTGAIVQLGPLGGSHDAGRSCCRGSWSTSPSWRPWARSSSVAATSSRPRRVSRRYAARHRGKGVSGGRRGPPPRALPLAELLSGLSAYARQTRQRHSISV